MLFPIHNADVSLLGLPIKILGVMKDQVLTFIFTWLAELFHQLGCVVLKERCCKTVKWSTNTGGKQSCAAPREFGWGAISGPEQKSPFTEPPTLQQISSPTRFGQHPGLPYWLTCFRWSTVSGRCCSVSKICCRRGTLFDDFELVNHVLRSL